MATDTVAPLTVVVPEVSLAVAMAAMTQSSGQSVALPRMLKK